MNKQVPKVDEPDVDLVARVISLADARDEFVQLEDGNTYYAPSPGHGALPSWALRVLANEMDKRDASWNAIINGDSRIGPGCLQVWKFDDAPEAWKTLHTRDGDEDWLALVPKVLIDHDDFDCAEIVWMHWFPRGDGFVKRYTEGAPEGFEIWVGAHA